MQEDFKVDFIICGAAKSGTTSLHYILDKHPEICMSNGDAKNELHFFCEENNFNKGIEWYQSFFDHCPKDSIKGQTAPSYLQDKDAPERIFKTFPNTKLVFIFRNPVDRAFSDYLTRVWNGKETENFYEALMKEPERSNHDPFYRGSWAYTKRGMYADQIERFVKFFPRENMFFLLTDDLNDNDQKELRRLQEFIGVDPRTLAILQENTGRFVYNDKLTSIRNNSQILKVSKLFYRIIRKFSSTSKRKYRPPLDSKSKDFLIKTYKESNARLSELIGKDLSHWNE
jgi:hypothetical protein